MVFTSVVEEIDSSDTFSESRLAWEALSSGAHHSPFLAWPWIAAWVETLPPGVRLYQVSLFREAELVAKALFARQRIRRNYIFLSKSFALHDYLFSGCNLMIEYNDVLTKQPSPALFGEVIKSLASRLSWDEIYLSGVGQSCIPVIDTIAGELACVKRVLGHSVARYVDLNTIRSRNLNVLASLSKKTRYKMRRYLNAVKANGEISISAPETPAQTQAYLTELIELHQAYWQSKGDRGIFDSSIAESFHRKLVGYACISGGVQLLKVRCGARTLGLVYSLVKDDNVYMIQSGYNYAEFRDSHPGYLCLLKVIQYNLDKEYLRFDFLSGDSQYKKSFSNAEENLYWLVLQRKKIKFRLESMLRSVRRRFLDLSDDVSF